MNQNIWLNVKQLQSFLQKIIPPNLPVLIVDDDPSIGKMITKFLNKQDFHNITTVESGTEAINIIKTTEFSVIFLDLSLPQTTGIEVLQKIKEHPESKCKDARVVILTGLPSLDTAVEAMKYGAYNYISKPVSMEDFYTAFEEAMENFYNQKRQYLIEKYAKDHKTEDILYLKRQLEQKEKEIEKLKKEIAELKQLK